MTLLSALVALTVSQVPAPVDVSAFKDKLEVITDGKGHYSAYLPGSISDLVLFHSVDGKTFHKVRTFGGSSDDRSWSLSLWDPRMWQGGGQVASLDMRRVEQDGGPAVTRHSLTCAKKELTLTAVPAEQARALLDKATFLGPLWLRVPEKLLRDENGTYYLIDRFRSEDPGDRRDFRVFAGPRGAMKQLPLKDIVDDSQGMIFATKNGNLRLVTSNEGKLEAKWVQGKASTPLIELDLQRYDTARLIYMDLGPYTGLRLGTPCDDAL